jgi:CRP-like cAMP-binding protein
MPISKEEFSRHFPSVMQHMRTDDVMAFVQALTPVQLASGETLIRDGERNDAIYFVQNGTLEASIERNGEKTPLGRVVPGQWLGEVSMLDPGPATATVMAISDCELLRLARKDFENLDRHRPMLMNVVLRALSLLLIERLRSCTDQLVRVADDRRHSSKAVRERSTDAYAALVGTRR